jgi:DNA-binding NtrC family response regulator
VRLIAATQRDLRAMIRDGTFREDLYYRLQGVRLVVPPLRDRKEELPALVDLFREQSGPQARRPSAAALDAMHQYHWPGNVRELENVVKRALVLATGRYLEPEDLDLGPPAERHAIRVVSGGDEFAASPTAPTPAAPTAPAPVSQDPEARWAVVLRHFGETDSVRGGGLSPRAYRDLVGVSRRTASRDLRTWVAEGRLSSRGQRRAVRYFLGPDATAASTGAASTAGSSDQGPAG